MQAMRVKLALSTLCEDPCRRTGLSTLFPEFVAHARRLFPEVTWLVFVGKGAPWPVEDTGVEVCRAYPSNGQPLRRLFADHFEVGREARARGAAALLTVGFFPVSPAGLPVAMHVFALNHLRRGRGVRDVYRAWAVSRGLDKASLVVVNSAWTKSRLGPAKGPILVSPEGLRHDLFMPDGPSGVPGITGRYILWASNFYAYKRVELALAAYAGLPATMRSEFPFVLAGGDWAGGRHRAEAEAARLSILKDVRFLGWVDDEALPALYRGASAYVLSTSEETFGRSVLESMACGCPCLVHDIPVLREVAGDCASYVDFADCTRASQALERICSDGDQRARLRASGIERSKLFSFDRLTIERVNAVLSMIGAAQP
jgi:glycosyltransferase involved in cell wall biosynthesis